MILTAVKYHQIRGTGFVIFSLAFGAKKYNFPSSPVRSFACVYVLFCAVPIKYDRLTRINEIYSSILTSAISHYMSGVCAVSVYGFMCYKV